MVRQVMGVQAPPARDASPPPMVRIGEWAFRQRSWLPVPLGLVLLFVRAGEVHGPWTLAAASLLVLGGLGIRMWAVRHIGTISRTRADRRGPLVATGPYMIVRNPLYVGNFLVWTGLVFASRLLWMLPVAWAVFLVQYGAIARWEQASLRQHYGADYDAFCAAVPGWWPRWSALGRAFETGAQFPWRDVFFSERGTLGAVALMALLLAIKGLWR